MRLGTALGLMFDIPALSRNIHLDGQRQQVNPRQNDGSARVRVSSSRSVGPP
jgi:hypothetical protein